MTEPAWLNTRSPSGDVHWNEAYAGSTYRINEQFADSPEKLDGKGAVQVGSSQPRYQHCVRRCSVVEVTAAGKVGLLDGSWTIAAVVRAGACGSHKALGSCRSQRLYGQYSQTAVMTSRMSLACGRIASASSG